MEIEAKYQILDEAAYLYFCEPSNWPAVPDKADWQSELYSAAYYDGPEHEVSALFSSVRLRREGERCVFTCKWPLNDSPESAAAEAGAVRCRGEFNLDLSPEQAEDWMRFLRTAAGALVAVPESLRKLLLSGRLQARYRADFRRNSVQFDFSGARLELAVDRGTLRAAGRSAELCELECELIAGRPEALYEFCVWLEKQPGLRVLPKSKFSRLLELEQNEAAG